MKKIYIGSKNPVKIECTRKAFEEVFPNESFELLGEQVPSGVADQPMSDEETLRGAANRALSLEASIADSKHFYVGIEGGIRQRGKEMEAFAWVVIIHRGQVGKAQTATFQLPPEIVKLIKKGVELGHADDIVFNRRNSKQGNGAVGLLTHDLIDRIEYYRPAVILALVPFLNSDLYSQKNG